MGDKGVFSPIAMGEVRGVFIDTTCTIDYILKVMLAVKYNAFESTAAMDLMNVSFEGRGAFNTFSSRIRELEDELVNSYHHIDRIRKIRNHLAHQFLPYSYLPQDLKVHGKDALLLMTELLNNSWYFLLKDFILVQGRLLQNCFFELLFIVFYGRKMLRQKSFTLYTTVISQP